MFRYCFFDCTQFWLVPICSCSHLHLYHQAHLPNPLLVFKKNGIYAETQRISAAAAPAKEKAASAGAKDVTSTNKAQEKGGATQVAGKPKGSAAPKEEAKKSATDKATKAQGNILGMLNHTPKGRGEQFLAECEMLLICKWRYFS